MPPTTTQTANHAAAVEPADRNAELARRATRVYTLALAFTALMAVALYVLLNSVTLQHRGSATLLNVAGSQRMLSQKIALYATDLHSGDQTARTPMQESIAMLERTNAAVRNGGDLGIKEGLSGPALAQNAATHDPAGRLVAEFIAHAKRFAASQNPAEAEATFRALRIMASETLLPALTAEVNLIAEDADARVHSHKKWQWFMLLVLLTTLAAEAHFVFRPMVRMIDLHAARLTELAERDPLTGLKNRRSFFVAGQREIDMSRRMRTPLSVLVLDLDNFKQINDRYGHAAGDAVLQRFAVLASEALRRTDIFGRIGGEEFALILPGADGAAAAVVAEKLREATAHDAPPGTPPVTVSIGVAQVKLSENMLDEAMKRADWSMYDAKRLGRNRVILAD